MSPEGEQTALLAWASVNGEIYPPSWSKTVKNILKSVAVLAAFALAAWLSWVPGDPAIASAPVPAAAAAVARPSTVKYPNCKKLNKKYKHGVGKKGAKDKVSGRTKKVTNFKKSNALYAANRHLDRDSDGIACEKR